MEKRQQGRKRGVTHCVSRWHGDLPGQLPGAKLVARLGVRRVRRCPIEDVALSRLTVQLKVQLADRCRERRSRGLGRRELVLLGATQERGVEKPSHSIAVALLWPSSGIAPASP